MHEHIFPGGMPVEGKRGNYIALAATLTALGALLLSIVSPALTYIGINTYWTDLFTGAIIVAAVITSALRTFHFPIFHKNKKAAEAK